MQKISFVKFKQRIMSRRAVRSALTDFVILTVIALFAGYLINVDFRSQTAGANPGSASYSARAALSAGQREDLRRLTMFRLARQADIKAGIIGLKTKESILALSQWLHLVVIQNQVRYSPAKISQYHDEVQMYREAKLFEISPEQSRQISAAREAQFSAAWRKLLKLNLKASWINFDSGLQMAGLQLQTKINPSLAGYSVTARGNTGQVLRWAEPILAVAEKYRLEPALVAAVVEQESGGSPNVISPAGAIGLMQLMPQTARGLGVNPFNPAENLDGGAHYLRIQLDRFGNLTDALTAYNAGPGRVGRALFPETAHYVQNVPALISKFRPLFRKQSRLIDLKPWLPAHN